MRMAVLPPLRLHGLREELEALMAAGHLCRKRGNNEGLFTFFVLISKKVVFLYVQPQTVAVLYRDCT